MVKSTWLIIDDKVGNAKQAIAIAKSMGLDYKIKRLKYNFLARLPNWLKFDTLIGINKKSSSSLREPFPDLVISSGRKTAAVSSYIKKINPKTFAVHLMHPDLPFKNFDLVCLPLHDQCEDYISFKNICYSIGAPCFLDINNMEESAKNLYKKEPDLKGPFVSLMIGGKTKKGDYSDEEFKWLIRKANKLASSVKGTLLITTSRRTSQTIDLKEITVPYYFYDWHKMKDQDNAYPAFLHISDYFITTGDSVSICSEVLATGKPLYVYRKDNLLYHKHRKFLDYLDKSVLISYLKDGTYRFKKKKYAPLQEAKKIGQVIEEKIKNVSTTVPS